jgi:hypothetical protein
VQHRHAFGQTGPNRADHATEELSRYNKQRSFGTGHRGIDVVCSDDRRIERCARQEERIFVPVVDYGDDFLVTRPQSHIRARAPRYDG